jgi:hypothetical protein
MNINFKIFVRRHFLQVVVFIYESIVGDIIGFNYYDFHFVSINSHTHTRPKIHEDS